MARHSLLQLPPLPLLDGAAAFTNDVTVAAARLGRVVPSMQVFDSPSGQPFVCRVAETEVNGLRMVASTATTSRMDVTEARGWHLILPWSGTGAMRIDGTTFVLTGGSDCILLPNVARSTTWSTRSLVIAAIDPDRLAQTARTLSGNPHFVLAQRPLRITFGPGQHDLLRRLFALLDATSATAGAGAMLGIDDTLYRFLAMQLLANPAPAEKRHTCSEARSWIDALCDAIREAGDHPLTLTQMETLAGMSARSLQVHFLRRFGCSPMQWQRTERLGRARQALIDGPRGLSITQLAYATGFASSAAFATNYRRQFGETPTETRQRVAG